MVLRSIIPFAVVIAVQALAGCGMPTESGVAHDDRPAWRNADFDARDARLRRHVEAGTFGVAQLFPDGMLVDARHLPPLPPPAAVPMPLALAGVARSRPSGTPVQLALVAAAGRANACVYKPIMSDADIDACR